MDLESIGPAFVRIKLFFLRLIAVLATPILFLLREWAAENLEDH